MRLWLVLWVCFSLSILLVSERAGAAPIVDREHCGNGIDDKQQYLGQEANCPNGWVAAKVLGGCDLLCPRPDEDWDGFKEVGACNYPSELCDCAPKDGFIYPGSGPTTFGCVDGSGNPNGKVRECQDNGTFTACSDWACPAGKNCKYFSPSGSNTTGDGSIGNPWRDLGKVSYWNSGAPYSLHTPVANDMFILRAGVYNFDNALGYGSRTFSCRNNTAGGTSSKIIITNYPGESVEIQSQATSSNPGAGLYLENCDSWTIRGIKITGGYGTPIQASGGSNDLLVQNVILTAPSLGDDNHSCIEVHTSNDVTLQKLIAYNCYKSASASSPNPNNNNLYLFFRTRNTRVLYPTGFYTAFIPNGGNGSISGACLRVKHSNSDSSLLVEGAVFENCGYGAFQLGGPDWVIQKWLVHNAVRILGGYDQGGTSFMTAPDGYLDFTRGVSIDGGGLEWAPTKGYFPDPSGTPAADKCSGSNGSYPNVIANLRITQNYIKSNISSYGAETREFRQWVYGPDHFYDLNKLTFQNNAWYNSNIPPTFGIHESNNGDTSCSDTARGVLGSSYSISQWQALGFDTDASGSKFGDCLLDEFDRCTASGYQDKGRILLSEEYFPVTAGKGFSAKRGLRGFR